MCTELVSLARLTFLGLDSSRCPSSEGTHCSKTRTEAPWRKAEAMTGKPCLQSFEKMLVPVPPPGSLKKNEAHLLSCFFFCKLFRHQRVDESNEQTTSEISSRNQRSTLLTWSLSRHM